VRFARRSAPGTNADGRFSLWRMSHGALFRQITKVLGRIADEVTPRFVCDPLISVKLSNYLFLRNPRTFGGVIASTGVAITSAASEPFCVARNHIGGTY